MKVTVLFTMEGCPFCTSIKEEFKKNNIDYIDRDIHKNEDEYNQFVELTQNEFVLGFQKIPLCFLLYTLNFPQLTTILLE